MILQINKSLFVSLKLVVFIPLIYVHHCVFIRAFQHTVWCVSTMISYIVIF